MKWSASIVSYRRWRRSTTSSRRPRSLGWTRRPSSSEKLRWWAGPPPQLYWKVNRRRPSEPESSSPEAAMLSNEYKMLIGFEMMCDSCIGKWSWRNVWNGSFEIYCVLITILDKLCLWAMLSIVRKYSKFRVFIVMYLQSVIRVHLQ